MKFRHPIENYVVICLFAVASLLAAYGVISAVNSGTSPQPMPMNASSAINCTFPDKSFCGTERMVKDFVANRDFSGILESQTPISTTCSGAASAQLYCKGVKDGLVIQLFQVKQDARSQLLTRNQYIAFFRSYFQAHGPFLYTATTASGSHVLMQYKSRNGSVLYTLQFTKAASTWKLAYPSIDTVRPQS